MILRKYILCWTALSSAVFCGTAFASAALPHVYVDGRAVSARALFGEVPTQEAEQKPAPKVEKNASSAKSSGGKAAARIADVLAPSRPSGDLWAKSSNSEDKGVIARGAAPAAKARVEKPLRLPEAQEFVLWDNDYQLPEEDLFVKPAKPAAVQRSSDNSLFAASRSSGVQPSRAKTTNPTTTRSESAGSAVRGQYTDPSVAREMQRIPDPTKPVSIIQNRFIPAPRVATTKAEVQQAAPANQEQETEEFDEIEYIETIDDAAGTEDLKLDDSVSLRRIVVPMEEERGPVAARRETSLARAAAGSDDDVPLTKLSPMQLKRAFQKTYISENKHLSTYKIDDRFDVASEVSYDMQGFDSSRDLSESGGVRPLEIKISFKGADSALSRDNYNLLSEYAGIVASNPKRAVQVSISEKSTRSYDGRKLAAKRLAIVEQVLKDAGVTDQRIIPVLSQRSDDTFVLRVISSDVYQTLSEKQRDMFGDTVSSKSSKSMSW